MGLIKLLLLAVLIYLGLTLWRRFQAKKAHRGSAATGKAAEVMVRCDQCRIHIPENTALRSDNHWYCCIEHRDAAHHD